jgi:hypothetical protein
MLNIYEIITISYLYIYIIWYEMIDAFIHLAFVYVFNCASLFAVCGFTD